MLVRVTAAAVRQYKTSQLIVKQDFLRCTMIEIASNLVVGTSIIIIMFLEEVVSKLFRQTLTPIRKHTQLICAKG